MGREITTTHSTGFHRRIALEKRLEGTKSTPGLAGRAIRARSSHRCRTPESAPTLPVALEQPLGFELRRERNRVNLLIVRSVERPRAEEN
jgi:hypothetical protein